MVIVGVGMGVFISVSLGLLHGRHSFRAKGTAFLLGTADFLPFFLKKIEPAMRRFLQVFCGACGSLGLIAAEDFRKLE